VKESRQPSPALAVLARPLPGQGEVKMRRGGPGEVKSFATANRVPAEAGVANSVSAELT